MCATLLDTSLDAPQDYLHNFHRVTSQLTRNRSVQPPAPDFGGECRAVACWLPFTVLIKSSAHHACVESRMMMGWTKHFLALSPTEEFLSSRGSCSQLSAFGCRKVSKNSDNDLENSFKSLSWEITSHACIDRDTTWSWFAWGQRSLLANNNKQTEKMKKYAKSQLSIANGSRWMPHNTQQNETYTHNKKFTSTKNKFQFSHHLPQNSMEILR